MSSLAFLIDFGSTYTKLIVVNLNSAEVIGRSQSASTVQTDVRQGLLTALAQLHEGYALFKSRPRDLGVLDGSLVLASSSAAGGLRMVVIGLVPGLTVEAANQAALGAGSKLIGSWSFKLRDQAIDEIKAQLPDMVLLTGGTDGGDSATILHNAKLLAASRLSVPVVVAGNQAVGGEVADILRRGGKEVRSAINVMPQHGKLQVESAREEIRKLFMERIIHAKGMDRLGDLVSVILPTPMAVLEGAQLGAQGTLEEDGWGDLLVVDVGGATTDVHSIGYGEPSGPQLSDQGLPEAFAKRTVEGDLGIRFNAGTLLERIGIDRFYSKFQQAFPHTHVSQRDIVQYIGNISRDTATVPQTKWQSAVDAELAHIATDIAIERHVGKKERIVAREGEAWIYYGKDLSETRIVIGTGGIFIYNSYCTHVLTPAMTGEGPYEVLRPKCPKLFVDERYLLYAVGLLARTRPDVALKIFKKYMQPLAA
jgi:uncharacterized protein (TIGR01319 family)